MADGFEDRGDAGRRLAARLTKYAGSDDVVVLALPRGGVPVAYEIATRLDVPMDVFLVRKLGVPGQSELAMGAIASGDVRFENRELIETLGIPRELIEHVAARELQEIERREQEYRPDRPALALEGKTVLLVDDGLATGATMRAAVEALRRHNVQRIVVAVPVGSRRTCEHLSQLVDEIVCLLTPDDFRAVGEWYADFTQTSDQEVHDLLRRAPRDKTSVGGSR